MTQPTDPTATICGRANCDRPADGFFICHKCAGELIAAMEAMPWLLTELETVIGLQTRYTTTQTHGTGTPAAMDFVAADKRRKLIAALRDLANAICEANGWGNAIDWSSPVSTLSAAAWIHWRISAVRLFPNAGTLTDHLLTAYKTATASTDRPPSLQYLGDCATLTAELGVAPCPGRVYGREGKTRAECNVCRMNWDARELRAYLIAALTDRLCTASEIADLGAYLNLSLTRDQTRKRLNQWHKRGTLPNSGTRDGAPVFRFGVAHHLLTRYELTA